MTTAGTELSAETQSIAGVTPPATLSFDWPPRGKTMTHSRPPPPPELRRFVRAMSELGVPVNEIARRLGEKAGLRNYSMRQLYRDFSEDLIPRMKRGKRGEQRARLVDKPPGWKPIRQGSPFSYGDLLAILQSDLDSRDLGRLYGVKDELIYRIRRGESHYTKYLLPRMTVATDDTPGGIAYRAMVTAELALRLVKQMALMIENHYAAERRKLYLAKDHSRTLYRRNAESGNMEERVIATDLEEKAAKLDGWKEEEPDDAED